MGISFCNQDLLLVPPELQDWLDQYLPLQETVLFGPRFGDEITNRAESRTVNSPRRVGIARPNYPPAPPLKINSLYWPTGAARYSRFVGLCNRERLDKIIESLAFKSDDGDAPLTHAPSEEGTPQTGGSLILSDNSVTPAIEVATSMYLLPPRPIVSLLPDALYAKRPYPGAWGLYLLPLVDIRYFWQFRSTGPLVVDAGDTWDSLYTTLSQQLGATISVNEVDDAYLFPDPLECSRRYESAAVLLDAVAHSVGHRICRQLDGTVKATSFDVSRYTLNNLDTPEREFIAGAGLTHDLIGMQESVSLIATKYVTKVQACGDYATDSTAGPGVDNTSRVIHSTITATFDTWTDGIPSNWMQLQTLADRISKDHRDSQFYYDGTLAGLSSRRLIAWDDHFEWTVGRFDPRFGYQANTRQQSSPYNFGIDEMLHQIEAKVLPAANYIAKTTSEISAMAGSTPGTGTAEIYAYDGSNNLVTTGVEDVAVFNTTASTVATDKWVQLKLDAYCRLLIDVADCAAS